MGHGGEGRHKDSPPLRSKPGFHGFFCLNNNSRMGQRIRITYLIYYAHFVRATKPTPRI